MQSPQGPAWGFLFFRRASSMAVAKAFIHPDMGTSILKKDSSMFHRGLLFDDDVLANAVVFIVVTEEVGAQLCRVAREPDVLEGDVVDTVAGGTVVLVSEDDGHADEGAAVNALHADIAEADVANPVFVTAGQVQDGVCAGIENVAVFNVDFAQRLAHVGAVITVRTDVHGMCHVGPECGAAHKDIFRAAPVPPTVVVKGDAVV